MKGFVWASAALRPGRPVFCQHVVTACHKPDVAQAVGDYEVKKITSFFALMIERIYTGLFTLQKFALYQLIKSQSANVENQIDR